MARILFAWELGANLGHLAQLVPLAIRLRTRGHRPIFVVSDVACAESMLGPHALEYLQAPLCRPRPGHFADKPCSYAEILHHYGYLDRDALLGIVKAWREIYRFIEPAAIVFEHAPTALLASRGFEAARMLYGVGFCSPPRLQPFPNFRIWTDVPRARLEASEGAVLDAVNAVLLKLKLRPLRALHELFEVDEDFLCTFPELDHYGVRSDAYYAGAVYTRDAGAIPVWPHEGDKRIYVYLRPGMSAFHPLAEILAGAGHRVLWFAPGVNEAITRRYTSASFSFARDPLRLSLIAQQAEAAVLYGGHGTVSAMLLGGVPLALYPVHVEQALVSHRVEQLGAGVGLGPENDDLARTLNRLLGAGHYTQKAFAFAERYRYFDCSKTVARIASLIGKYCATARSTQA